jgi:RNA polymerase sigma factor (sigma-70 family)
LTTLAHLETAEERELVHEIAARRPADAAARLYSLYRRRIQEYCIGQLRERQEADDATQSTFLYAYTLLQRGVVPRRPLPWLYAIAHNVCRTRRRALKLRGRVESGVDLDTLHETVGRNDEQHDDLDELGGALAALPTTQRKALLLREWKGLSYAEIATQLGITSSAVEALLFRARRNLARGMQRTTARVASVVNGAILLRGIRRVLPLSGPGKATATAMALGVVATGAAVAPFVASKPVVHRAPAVQHAAHTTVVPPTSLPAPVHVRVGATRAHGHVPTHGSPAGVAVPPSASSTEQRPEPAPTSASVGTASAASPDSKTLQPAPTPPPAVQVVADDARGAVPNAQTTVGDVAGSLPAAPDTGPLPQPVQAAVSTVTTAVSQAAPELPATGGPPSQVLP